VNYRDDLLKLQDNFSKEAFASYVESLANNGYLEKLKQERLTIKAEPIGSPVMFTLKPLRDKADWKVEVPIKISYENIAGEVSIDKFLAEVWLKRNNLSKYAEMVEVNQIVIGKLP
jgi:hypothetical protein